MEILNYLQSQSSQTVTGQANILRSLPAIFQDAECQSDAIRHLHTFSLHVGSLLYARPPILENKTFFYDNCWSFMEIAVHKNKTVISLSNVVLVMVICGGGD